MPNVRQMIQYADGGPQALTIVASDGLSITITKQQIQDFYQGTSGNAASRKAQTIAFVQNAIATALNPQQVPSSAVGLDFDLLTGSLSVLSIGEIGIG